MKTIVLRRPECALIGPIEWSSSGLIDIHVSSNPRWPEVLLKILHQFPDYKFLILMGNVHYSQAAQERILAVHKHMLSWFMGRPEPRHGHCSELFAMGGDAVSLLPAVESAVNDGAFRLWDIYAAYNGLPTRFSTCPEVRENLIIQDDETEDFFSDDDVKAWQGYRYEAQQIAEAHRLWTTHGMNTRHVINKMKREAK